ncbi:SDR family oxidoreductase [Deminuibacter soli]|uniref:SDR family NAD(P)-dependent oxidoreductase n=1 Tax=Deminuibacter soli TaxID=2291815 RepID=A0A3E1NKG6_9BACT|nr:SDR family oxidoreductase [Deminuibacter soli]RFM28324.1 SDR family NAD(P)-dependent oxidoreductase [Deminuibacter soli]
MKNETKKNLNIPQTQERPGTEKKMKPLPVTDNNDPGSGKLSNKIALITGGDSGIGKAVALLFAKEGADIAIVYLNETADASDTKHLIEKKYSKTCLAIAGDVSTESFCHDAVQQVIDRYGRIDVLVNNAGIHYETPEVAELDTGKMELTFRTNVFSMFWMVKHAVKHMPEGASIINTSSVTAYRGSASLLDYAATKGAIVSFTRSLASHLVKNKIRVNGVAPGPIWTPLIIASFNEERVAQHGSEAPMERPGEPIEVAPSYLFLASRDSSYMTGQFLHPNGGEIVNG